MKSINRRVGKLEQRLGTVPSAGDLRIWELAETVRKRRATRLGEPFIPRTWEHRRPTGRSIAEILRSGRVRGGSR